MNPPSLDPIDRKLVALLQGDADLTHEALAERVHLSASAVQRRVNRLRAAGVLRGIVAVPNPSALGIGFSAIVEVVVRSDRPEATDGFTRWLRRQAEVQSAWAVTGEADYVLVLRCRSMEHFKEVTDAMLAAAPAVEKFKTLGVLSELKHSLAVPLLD